MALKRSTTFSDPENAQKYREARVEAMRAQRASQQANSAWGLTKGTILGTPRATLDVGKEIGQGIARSFLAVGAKIAERDVNASFTPYTSFEKALTGGRAASFTSAGQDIRGAGGTDSTLWFDPIVGAGIVALDVLPFGGARRGYTQAFKEISRTGNKKVIGDILTRDLGFSRDVAARLSGELAESTTPRAVGETIARVQQLDLKPTISMLTETANKSSSLERFRRNIPGQTVYRVIDNPAQLANARRGQLQSVAQGGWGKSVTEVFNETKNIDNARFVIQGKALDNGFVVPFKISDAQTGRLIDDLTATVTNKLGVRGLADDSLSAFRSNLRSRIPKLAAKDKELAKIALKMDNEDAKLAIDFIDNVRMKKPENVKLEIEARRMANAMGINPEQTNAKLANELSRLMDVARFGGYGSRQAAQQGAQGSMGAFAGVKTDEEGNVEFDPAMAALGIVGATAASRKIRRPDGSLPETIYAANRATRLNRGVKDQIRTRGGKFGRAIVDWKDGKRAGFLGKAMAPLSTRLRAIDPSLKRRMRGYEYNLMQRIQKDDAAIKGFMDNYTSLPKEVRTDLDLAMKNSDMPRINQIAKEHGFERELTKLRGTLDGVHQRAKDVGYDVGYHKDYFPRVVSDPKGLVRLLHNTDDWSDIEQAIELKQATVKRVLTDDEVVNLVNSTLRGYGSQLKTSTPANLKGRKIDVLDAELNQYYEDSGQAMLMYIQRVNEAVETKKFFGKHFKQSKEGSMFLDLDSSVGAFTTDLLAKGRISPAQEKELADILRARFDQRYIGQFLGAYKNLSYISTMGSPISAITQLGDLAFALQVGGVRSSVKGVIQTLAGKSYYTKKDLGIERITQEFMDRSWGANLVNRVFKVVGLDALDKLGKNTISNAVLDSYMRAARTGNWKPGQRERLMEYLGTQRGYRAIRDLKNGRMTEDTKFVAFNELLDIQPVAASEMPEYYLRGGNARILYMLKSFTIKQFDFMRERILANPHMTPAQRAQEMMKFAVFFMGANATADEIKDWMLGRETSFKDRTIDNVMRLAGLSKWALWQARDEGIGSAAFGQFVVPPDILAEPLSDAYKAATGRVNDVSDLKTPQNIPVVGKLWYWWFGRGARQPGGRLNPEGTRTIDNPRDSLGGAVDLGLNLDGEGVGAVDLELGF